MKTFPRTILFTAILGLAWAGSIAFGMRVLARFENTPGRVGAVPAHFPAGSALRLASDRPTLIMLAHPRCPCTRASLGELARIMAELQGKVKAYVVFSRPADGGRDWNDTGAWRTAAEIPGLEPVGDDDGYETRRLGGATSGHTLLYAANGHLLFSGGITETRGHAGENAGEFAVVALVKQGAAKRTTTPVFGCPLVGNTVADAKKLCPN